MMRSVQFAALAAALTTAASVAVPAVAQDEASSSVPGDQPEAAAAPTERIVVTAPRRGAPSAREHIEDFVLEIGDPTDRAYALARWGTEVCVAVQDLPEDAAQFVADQVSTAALDVGLEVGGPGCQPNILIIFTLDGASVARAIAEQTPSVLFPTGFADGATQGLSALAKFTSSDAPVRWWQTTALLDRNDNLVVQDYSHGHANRPVESDISSRIRVPPTSEFLTMHIIVDASKLDGVGWRQVADYLSMVALTQVDPDASAAGYESILNLFDADPAPSSMTDWDRSYLHSLYGMSDHLSPRAQRNRLVNAMMDSGAAD